MVWFQSSAGADDCRGRRTGSEQADVTEGLEDKLSQGPQRRAAAVWTPLLLYIQEVPFQEQITTHTHIQTHTHTYINTQQKHTVSLYA